MQKDESVNYIQIIYMLHVELQQTVLFERNACDVYVIDVFVGIWQSVNRQMEAASAMSTLLLTRSGTSSRWNGYKMAATVAISEGAASKLFNLYTQGRSVLTYAGVFVCVKLLCLS